jgi:hypothetical protein
VVDRIAPQATVRNSIKGFATRIVIKNIDARVQPGMTATITVPVASADNVLAVPLGAVFTEQGERYVYVKNGEEFEKRPVQVGLSDYFYAEVASGVKAGEVVSLEVPASELSKLGRSPGGKGALAGAPGAPRVAGGAREGRGADGLGGGSRMSRTNAASIGGTPRPVKSGT